LALPRGFRGQCLRLDHCQTPLDPPYGASGGCAEEEAGLTDKIPNLKIPNPK
jgi:hypothetical protein